MINSIKNTFFLISIFVLIALSPNLFLSRCGNSLDKNKIRGEYLESHEYKRQELNKVMNDIRTIEKKLDLLVGPSPTQLSCDSTESLLRESLIVLLKCERIVYDMRHFERRDSLMFENYGK